MDEKTRLDRGIEMKAFLTAGKSCIHFESSILREASNTVIKLTDTERKHRNSLSGQWTVYCIFSTVSPVQLHGTMQFSNLPDSKRRHSSLMMEAKLAACSPDESLRGLESMSFDFSKMLEQKSTADVTLRCGNHTFSAHRCILGARSEVFAAMFRNGMVESETGSIDITDMDGEVLDLLLKYVYSGKISDLSANLASSLYKAANKYSIHSLKNECSNWMLASLSSENCLDFLLLAHACGDESFQDRLVNFVTEIMTNLGEEAGLKFSKEHPKLTFIVLRRLALKNKRG